jgi:hypothetical protein
MKILVENEFVKSWIDDEAPIILTRLLKEPANSIMLQQFCDLQEKFIKEVASQNNSPVYSICDSSSMPPFMFELLVNYYLHIFPKHQRAGLIQKAFVKPRNFDFLGDMIDLQRKIGDRPVGIFESFDQAFYHIKNEWKQSLVKKIAAA